ncbi:MAG: hypothetical protein JWO06_1640, partial [Bacteroidota bacterium]|nr:hypothetical protein [Bacteroidota bacterium]
MKKYIFTAAFGLLSGLLIAQDSYKLSLTEAIDFAMKNQPGFQNYKIDQQISAAKHLESISKYLPRINGSIDLRDNLKLGIVALQFPNPITGLEQQLKIQQGTKYVGTGSVDLTQPIIDGGAIGDIKYATQQSKLTDLQLQQAAIDLKINVSRNYYLVLLNTERVKKAEKSLERDQKAYDDTKVKYDNQNALKSDLNRSYLNLQNSKYQLKVSQDSVKTSAYNLAQVIGLPINSKLELSDALPGEVKTETVPEYPDFKAAEQNRVELKTESMQESLNKLQYKKTGYLYIPTLSGYASIGGQGLDDNNLLRKDSWYWNSYVGIKLTVPIFDGLQKMAQAQQQKLAIRKNENNLNNIRQTINYQLQTSSVNYLNAFNNLQLIKENVKLAEEVVQDVNVRYKNSVATYQEVLDTENTLKETEFNYLQALYVYLVTELDW